jgi:hypothetical protein
MLVRPDPRQQRTLATTVRELNALVSHALCLLTLILTRNHLSNLIIETAVFVFG